MTAATSEILLEAGAEVNARIFGRDGKMALQPAAEGGNLEILHLLLTPGQMWTPRQQKEVGRTALQAAVEQRHLQVAKVLINSAKAAKFNGRTALEVPLNMVDWTW